MVANPKASKKQKTAGRVSHIADEHLAGKLLAMGILPGSRLEVYRKAPFGGSWYVRVDDMLIALRQEELDSIVLK